MIIIRFAISVLLLMLLHNRVHAQEKPDSTANKISDTLNLKLKDTDGDGVNDDYDKCIDEKGPVDNFGCPVIKNWGIIDYSGYNYFIFFANGSSRLSYASVRLLDTIIKRLKGDTELRVTLNGYTDSAGNEDLNINLAEKRAHAVRRYLLSAGVHKENIMCITHGLQYPIEYNKTKAGRAKNRRVVVNLNKY